MNLKEIILQELEEELGIFSQTKTWTWNIDGEKGYAYADTRYPLENGRVLLERNPNGTAEYKLKATFDGKKIETYSEEYISTTELSSELISEWLEQLNERK